MEKNISNFLKIGVLIIFYFYSTKVFAESQWGDFQALLTELHEPASVAFVSDDQKIEFKKEAQEASRILTAQLDEVAIESIGMGAPMVPMTRVQLSNMTLYKGKEVTEKSLFYLGLPDAFVDLQNKRVIVFLEASKTEGSEKIIKIQKANDWKLTILKELFFQKDGDCDKPAVPVCDVEESL